MRWRKAGFGEYNLRGYGAMIADRARMDAYRAAMARAVKPGDVVLDIGAGTGILSLIACQLGASKVHAIEPSDALAVGRELAHANGFADRIEFHYKPSFELTLEERADVMVSDLRGNLPPYGSHLPAIVDARRRLLAPGGAQIGQRDVLIAQLVGDAALYEEAVGAWKHAPGLDLSPALRWATHNARKVDLAQARLLGAPRPIIELDYRTLESADARGSAQWEVTEDAAAHGLGVWFDASLFDEIGFSCAPDRPRTIYGQMFFPFTEPLALRRGERVTVTLSATLVGQEYVWQWNTTVGDGRGARLELRQSSFQGAPVEPGRLARRAGGYVPPATPRARAAARALALVAQQLPVERIAARIAEEFAGELDAGEARELVGDLCDWLGD